jgi:hypothetical protein
MYGYLEIRENAGPSNVTQCLATVFSEYDAEKRNCDIRRRPSTTVSLITSCCLCYAGSCFVRVAEQGRPTFRQDNIKMYRRGFVLGG